MPTEAEPVPPLTYLAKVLADVPCKGTAQQAAADQRQHEQDEHQLGSDVLLFSHNILPAKFILCNAAPVCGTKAGYNVVFGAPFRRTVPCSERFYKCRI